MKTIAFWIAGIFALGLLVGGFVTGIASEETAKSSDIENALTHASLVDCGPGRQALLEPVVQNGETVAKVRCVPMEAEDTLVLTEAAVSPVRAVPAMRTISPDVYRAPAPRPTEPAPVSVPAAEETKSSRSWKDSALIIGSSAGAGAGIGALAKGGKGAVVGAAIGGVAGTVYDLSTRNKNKK